MQITKDNSCNAEAMIKITESTEKEFYFSQKLKDFRGGNICLVNNIEYNFAVLKGTTSGKKIVEEYKKKYDDVRLVFQGSIRNCSIQVLRRKINQL